MYGSVFSSDSVGRSINIARSAAASFPFCIKQPEIKNKNIKTMPHNVNCERELMLGFFSFMA